MRPAPKDNRLQDGRPRGSQFAAPIVRPRTQNLAATVFVFERTKRPYTTHVVYLDQASCYTDHPGWKHTATLDPAAWIEWLMNHPKERERQVEELMARPNEKLTHGGNIERKP